MPEDNPYASWSLSLPVTETAPQQKPVLDSATPVGKEEAQNTGDKGEKEGDEPKTESGQAHDLFAAAIPATGAVKQFAKIEKTVQRFAGAVAAQHDQQSKLFGQMGERGGEVSEFGDKSERVLFAVDALGDLQDGNPNKAFGDLATGGMAWGVGKVTDKAVDLGSEAIKTARERYADFKVEQAGLPEKINEGYKGIQEGAQQTVAAKQEGALAAQEKQEADRLAQQALQRQEEAERVAKVLDEVKANNPTLAKNPSFNEFVQSRHDLLDERTRTTATCQDNVATADAKVISSDEKLTAATNDIKSSASSLETAVAEKETLLDTSGVLAEKLALRGLAVGGGLATLLVHPDKICEVAAPGAEHMETAAGGAVTDIGSSKVGQALGIDKATGDLQAGAQALPHAAFQSEVAVFNNDIGRNLIINPLHAAGVGIEDFSNQAGTAIFDNEVLAGKGLLSVVSAFEGKGVEGTASVSKDASELWSHRTELSDLCKTAGDLDDNYINIPLGKGINVVEESAASGIQDAGKGAKVVLDAAYDQGSYALNSGKRVVGWAEGAYNYMTGTDSTPTDPQKPSTAPTQAPVTTSTADPTHTPSTSTSHDPTPAQPKDTAQPNTKIISDPDDVQHLENDPKALKLAGIAAQANASVLAENKAQAQSTHLTMPALDQHQGQSTGMTA